jgi:hypothetical protein
MLAAALVLVALPALAQGMVPADLQVPLLLKVLDYDRNFSTKAGKELMIGVVYAPSDPASVGVTNEISGILLKYRDQRKTVRNVPINVQTIIYRSPEELEKTLRKDGIKVVYVAPGLSRRAVEEISRVCKNDALRVTTVTGVREFVDYGIAVGVAKSPNPKIFVNVAASRSEGSEFDASLLRLASIVR